MAAVGSSSEQAADLMQQLSLDTQASMLQVPEATNEYDAPVNSGTLANGLNKPFERTNSHLHRDPTMFYQPNGYPSSTYVYAGYDGSINNWDNYTRSINSNGIDMSTGVYGNNGALMYHHGYGYAPYGTYSPSGLPVTAIGHDQLYRPQNYQYPNTYFQTSTTTSGPYTPNQANASQAEFLTSVAAEQPLLVEPGKGNQNGVGGVAINGTNMSKLLIPSFHNTSINSNGSHGRVGSAKASAGISSAVSCGNNFRSGRNQNVHPFSHLMGLQHPRSTAGLGQEGFMNRTYPNNRRYGQYSNTFRSGTGFGTNSYNSKINGYGCLAIDSKNKPRGLGNGLFGHGNENADSMNELNKGPREKGFKDQKDSGPITVAVKGQSLPLNENNNEDNLPACPDREQYNREDFPENYADAKFFIIKSYSEDDVHRSMKYGLWTSTPNGNKKLDAAYKEAQEKSGGCPVFLLFSVNASGQFVGLAEMVGFVDFNRNVEYWQQDKWNGCFAVRWHIIKDVPNSLLRHITLENNENKPVTNSRDTQEVTFGEGIQMLKIFKGHLSKTCILDDFEFYERRQKIMLGVKAKQQLFNKQVGNRKPAVAVTDDLDKDGSIGNRGLQKSLNFGSTPSDDSIAAVVAVSEVLKSSEDRSS